MSRLFVFSAFVLASGWALAAPPQGVDPASPLASRIGPVPQAMVKLFTDGGAPAPSTHVLSAAERAKVLAAFDALTPLQRRILGERLRTLSFADGFPNTGLTQAIELGNGQRVFDLTIRASVLGETVSEMINNKERTLFDAAGSSLSVTVDAGSLDAIVYILLHEAAHMVDGALGLTDGAKSGGPTAFAATAWSDRTMPVPAYRDTLLESINYRRGGKAIEIGKAQALYQALERTPYASLYGSSNYTDDLAELVAFRHLTGELKQPYRIEIRDGGKLVYSYEPMKSPLVRSRDDQLAPFFRG